MGYRVRHKGVPNGMRYEDANGKERIVLYDGTGSAVARGAVRRVAYDSTNKRLCAKALASDASQQQVVIAAEPCAAGAKGEYYIKGSGITLTVPSGTYTAGDGLQIVGGAVADTGSAFAYTRNEFAAVETGGASTTSITVTLFDLPCGEDVKWMGTTSGAYMQWDASADELVFDKADISLGDTDSVKFGDGDDVTMAWSGSTFQVLPATDDTGKFEIGNGTKDFDFKHFLGTTSDHVLFDVGLKEVKFAGESKLNLRNRVEIFDDFLYQTIAETDTPWVLNSGADTEAIDPAINAQEGGVIRLTTGDADGTMANDGSQIVCAVPVQADGGGLVFETRLHINTAITDISVCAGLTDSTSLEEPFSIGASDAITSTASDAACFVYDTGADTDEWFACAVDSDTDDSGNATTSQAPVADTYQILRIEVSSDGATIKFYIDGTLVKTLSGDAGVSPDVNLYATVSACATTTTSKTVDVDYIYVGHER